MPDPSVSTNPRERTGVTPPEGGGVLDASADLLDAAVTYVRQETGDLVREKIVGPTQRAGVTVALALAIAVVASLGIGFVSVGLLILLADLLGWPAALFVVGGVLLVGSGVIGYLRSRKVCS